jgi:hypothetical protein
VGSGVRNSNGVARRIDDFNLNLLGGDICYTPIK